MACAVHARNHSWSTESSQAHDSRWVSDSGLTGKYARHAKVPKTTAATSPSSTARPLLGDDESLLADTAVVQNGCYVRSKCRIGKVIGATGRASSQARQLFRTRRGPGSDPESL